MTQGPRGYPATEAGLVVQGIKEISAGCNGALEPFCSITDASMGRTVYLPIHLP